MDSRGEQAEYNYAKQLSGARDRDRIPAHFIRVLFDHAARPRVLRPVAHLAEGLPLPPHYGRAVTLDEKSPSLMADLRGELHGIFTVVGPSGNEADDVFLILKPYQRLMCEGRLDLAIHTLEKRIRLYSAHSGSTVQLPLHVIALARLLQQAGWLTEAKRYIDFACELGRDTVPELAWDFLTSIKWKIELVAKDEDWESRAALLNEAQRHTGSFGAPFIWRQALAERRIGRASLADELLKRYQDNALSGTDSYKQSVSNFFAAQERFLAREWDEAVVQAGSLADVEMSMLGSPGEQPTASLNAIIGAEALRAIILIDAERDVSEHAVRLLQDLRAASQQFLIGEHAESLSDIALPWPVLGLGSSGECRLPKTMWLIEPTLKDQMKRLSEIHLRLSALEREMLFPV